jgi:hypothetical protein
MVNKLAITLSLCLLTALTALKPQTVQGATESWWSFTPDSGGPGTVIQVKGGHWFIGEPVVGIYLVRPLATDQDGQITKFEPLGGPLATAQLTEGGGSFDVTIVLRGRMPDGSPISTSALGIAVIGEQSYAKTGRPDGSVRPFKFIPASLPSSGKTALGDLLLLAISACMVVLAGALARWKGSVRYRCSSSTPPVIQGTGRGC